MNKVLFALFLVLVMSAEASAQAGKHVSLGVGLGAQHYVDGEHFESKDPVLQACRRDWGACA